MDRVLGLEKPGCPACSGSKDPAEISFEKYRTCSANIDNSARIGSAVVRREARFGSRGLSQAFVSATRSQNSTRIRNQQPPTSRTLNPPTTPRHFAQPNLQSASNARTPIQGRSVQAITRHHQCPNNQNHQGSSTRQTREAVEGLARWRCATPLLHILQHNSGQKLAELEMAERQQEEVYVDGGEAVRQSVPPEDEQYEGAEELSESDDIAELDEKTISAFLRTVKVVPEDVKFEDDEEVRIVTCRTTFRCQEANVDLKLSYHHRARCSSMEHAFSLSVTSDTLLGLERGDVMTHQGIGGSTGPVGNAGCPGADLRRGGDPLLGLV
ncbi:hypothetical protein BDK51DRAFT_46374 [Blyttiomyces helicus]|uniref:Uncharacterized protein n=1 Tax=Blyttiomyces helicus TaxID=388810 RepID=A0A4P9WMV6_9FUNG|nr:hypothetical protein BDK51DRAFT_46374 [Blyttiomyces helicus]|eukprot:RKO93018.1 hypothetical protein BDK51DRAFT_46374 [Blyttiomyces helicus]